MNAITWLAVDMILLGMVNMGMLYMIVRLYMDLKELAKKKDGER